MGDELIGGLEFLCRILGTACIVLLFVSAVLAHWVCVCRRALMEWQTDALNDVATAYEVGKEAASVTYGYGVGIPLERLYKASEN